VNASIVDLRYKTKQILEALDRREIVSVLYHGKVKGRLVPEESAERKKVQDSAFFGMRVKDRTPVPEVMQTLRGGRYRDL
jgi:antitoxin (DNA-binding transcriptional repressor) of toxin-antitoxin stability system